MTSDLRPSTMRAVVQDGYGSADVLRSGRVDVPRIGEDEVLVQVRAAGLDRGTWHLMTGRPYLLRLVFGLTGPRNPVPGRDVAGIVAAVGPRVTAFAVGDEVFGVAPGSFAEYAVAREDKLAPKPGNLSFEEAAVVPISGGTALQAVCDLGHVAAGQRVLVLGASGGVGSFAVQLAAVSGAEVTGACSSGKADLVRSLGAAHVLDHAVEDFADTATRYDLIIDIAGRPSLSRLRRALTPTGTAVLVGDERGGTFAGGIGRQLRAMALSRFVGQRLVSLVAKERASDFRRLRHLVEAGRVTPRVDRTYPLEEAGAAMAHLESGRVRGKIAVTV